MYTLSYMTDRVSYVPEFQLAVDRNDADAMLIILSEHGYRDQMTWAVAQSVINYNIDKRLDAEFAEYLEYNDVPYGC